MPENRIDPPFDCRCGRRAKGIRCEAAGIIGADTDGGDTLWLCAEHFAELMRMMKECNVR